MTRPPRRRRGPAPRSFHRRPTGAAPALVAAVCLCLFAIGAAWYHGRGPVAPAPDAGAESSNQTAAGPRLALPWTLLPFLDPSSVRPGPPRVGLQVGHWRSDELPAELAHLRPATGAHWEDISEAEVVRVIAERTADFLRERGFAVDLLPATVPPAYQAGVFIAVHADASTSPTPRGFKVAGPWRSGPETERLVDLLAHHYAESTGLPQDPNLTDNMRGYYAFSGRRFEHAIDAATPAAIIETGFLTNVQDRQMLLSSPERSAEGIARAIVAFAGHTW